MGARISLRLKISQKIIMRSIKKSLGLWAISVAIILMVPFIATQFSSEFNWGLFDFIFVGTVLFGAGLTYELIARKTGDVMYRSAVGVAIATAIFLVWVNGAVGIIGDGPINLLYFGVLATGLIGSIIARFKPQGMSRALFAMAIAQALIPVIALFIGEQNFSPSVLGVFILNTFFTVMFLVSALLFRHATK
ncbi:MAG: hypothetical protein ACD_9C00190G0003 [uncultured bacterium]|nr:MAG: hypothetical protein ACD_9C00190G0003 [uncultured bacterium]